MADNKKSSISKRSSCYLMNLKQPEKTARRLKLSFQRTSASVRLLKSVRSVEAAVGLLDVSLTGAGVFTPELLHKGSMVELCITEPSVLKVRGIVAWSIPVTSGIHLGRFNCRSGIQFVYDGEIQQMSVREFVRKAGMDPIESLHQQQAAAEAAAEAAKLATPSEVIPTPAEMMAPPVVAEVPPVVAEAPPVVAEAPPVVAETPPVVAEVPSAEAAPAAESVPIPEEGQKAA